MRVKKGDIHKTAGTVFEDKTHVGRVIEKHLQDQTSPRNGEIYQKIRVGRSIRTGFNTI